MCETAREGPETGAIIVPSVPTLIRPGSMAAWIDTWIDSRVARGHTSTREDRSHYEHHVQPFFGDRHVRDWTQDDMRGFSRALDSKVIARLISWKTATNIWGTVTKICDDAVSSKLDDLRVRDDNPALNVLGPDRGARTLKQYLYPSEFLTFVSCEEVPLLWKRVVAIAIYLYPRAGELRVLPWEDVDLDHRTIHIHRAIHRVTGETKATKTGHARRFSIEPTITPLLELLHDEKDDDNALVTEMPSLRDLARGLRRWLLRAGVDRSELHEGSPTRKAITFYDLRATGITWRAVRGDDPLKIQRAAGHTDFATTQEYIREAESVRDGFGTPFPTLPDALLTSGRILASAGLLAAKKPRTPGEPGVPWRGGRDSNPRPPA